MPLLSIIIPCYFNELNIPVTVGELVENESLFPQQVSFEYVFVDDGSKDNTFQALLNVKQAYPDKVKVVKLASNVGSYNAMVAGMEYATGECVVIISADLQDPPELMVKMYDYWRQGIKLVIASRKDRQDPFLSKLFANTFHAIMRKIAIKNLPQGGFDFVLFDGSIRQSILEMKERNTNVLYLLVWMGYDFVTIPYVRKERSVGISKWTWRKKIKLLLDSVMSFSYAPIRAISVMGIGLGMAAFLYALFLIVAKVSGAIQVEGWSSLMVVLLFVSSFQMIALGILGEYVWRGWDAARKRPLYIVEQVI
ncbi:glycosyltransferase family 2 protein [Rufibacter sp. LB8]|uniref:glycosyltransferase family 2 protein n=1 Tax=Rufibacter sp. LB8 TaxID=2777781 RepID=UPI00178C3AEF|nr:glycosyltransferase family 2 protein [Rufibacter sp. LB8]